jgi:hypothetical protein
MRARPGVVPLLLIGAAVWTGIRCSGSEETRVIKQFDRLSERVSRDSEETIIETARKAHSIASLFSSDCVVVTDEPALSGAYGREDMANRVSQVRSSFTRLRLRFHDLAVELDGPGSATAVVTGRVTGWTRYQERVDESREVVCTLKKTDGEWLFSRIEVVDVLER